MVLVLVLFIFALTFLIVSLFLGRRDYSKNDSDSDGGTGPSFRPQTLIPPKGEDEKLRETRDINALGNLGYTTVEGFDPSLSDDSLLSDPKTLGFKESRLFRYEDGSPFASPGYLSMKTGLESNIEQFSGNPKKLKFNNDLLGHVSSLPVEKQIALSDGRVRAKYFHDKTMDIEPQGFGTFK